MVPQDSLAIRGPGYARFSVSGNYSSSVITARRHRHAHAARHGDRTRALSRLRQRQRRLRLFGWKRVRERHRRAPLRRHAVRSALGGGIYAAGNLTLFYSAVYSNGARGAATGGDGVALGVVGPGGVLLHGNLRAHRSTANSTIAYNLTDATLPDNCFPGALLVWNDVEIESSILARNTCNSTLGFDITGFGSGPNQPPPPVVTGADNLIERFAALTVPADTMVGVDPQRGSLASNGGRTLTYLPASTSVMIDHGNNLLDFLVDQRGDGFPRTKGARTDIGAVER